MEKVVVYCDKCGKPDAHKYEFEVDGEQYGAGDTDTVTKRVDMCGLCASAQLELFILALPWTARLKLHADISKDKKFYLSHMSRSQRVFGLTQ